MKAVTKHHRSPNKVSNKKSLEVETHCNFPLTSFFIQSYEDGGTRWMELKGEGEAGLGAILGLPSSLISSLYQTLSFCCCSMTFLARSRPTMPLKLDGPESGRRYCSGRAFREETQTHCDSSALCPAVLLRLFRGSRS